MVQQQLQCQSCGMPLSSPDVHGSDASGGLIQDYCIYCYKNGQFTQQDYTVEDMINTCVPFLIEQGIEEEAARGVLASSLPGLKRWSSEQEEPIFTVVQLDELKLVGISAITTNARETTDQARIGGLWERFWSEGVQHAIPQKAPNESQPIYGCYCDYEVGASGEYKLLIGCEVLDVDSLPAGLEAKVIPAAKYARFATRSGPMPAVVIEVWQAIWRWSATSELKRTFTGDFELYDERSADPENAQVDIYIAVK